MKEENGKTLNPQQHLPILGSIVDYLERHGFPKSAKSLLKSEQGIENGGWKTRAPKLEDMFGNYLEKLKETPEPTAAVEGRPGVNYIVLKEGTPGGTRACNGQQVSIKYICTVKDSGAIICSNMCSAPWQFKLGCDEQKKDLHDGILGMQVGEKRRIDTFSSFARSGNDGERNLLVYDVELLDVN